MSFSTHIRRFLKRIILVWLQTNIIFGISTKNWVDLCMFQIVSPTFFSAKFFSLLPLKDMKRLRGSRGENLTSGWCSEKCSVFFAEPLLITFRDFSVFKIFSSLNGYTWEIWVNLFELCCQNNDIIEMKSKEIFLTSFKIF